MKLGTRLGVLATVALGVVAMGSTALALQEESAAVSVDPRGDWVDLPQPGAQGPRMAIHLWQQLGRIQGTLDIPDRGASAVPLSDVEAQGASLNFDVPQVSGRYTGAWSAEKQAYVGHFTSPHGEGALVLVRGKLTPPPVDWNAPPAPGLAYAPGPAARARVGVALPVGKCVNMANMLEAPKEGDWGPAIREDDFRTIKAAGFATVRIPVSWSTHAEFAPPYAIDPAFLRRVHQVVDLATAAGLNVILNVHHYNELMSDPTANTARFVGLWRQIAASFASAPPSVWFELLNEPHDKLTNANLTPVIAPALAAVRATNATRPVLIGGEHWSSLESLNTLILPDDPYVVPTFHDYDPFAFTHQGATWLPHLPPFGRAYGSTADKALLDGELVELKAYMARTGRVPVLGEYGATDDPRLPLDQRLRYYRTMSAAFASIGVQSCAWGYSNAFRLRNGQGWLPGMVESIATTTTR